MNGSAIAQEALARAQQSASMANFAPIFAGSAAMGIPESDIQRRENVLTYHAWRAVGRQVRRGEHGVKICTWIPMTKMERKRAAELRNDGRNRYHWPDMSQKVWDAYTGPERTANYVAEFTQRNNLKGE